MLPFVNPLPHAMKTKTISLFLGLSALVCLTDARAITIAENTAGTDRAATVFSGQSFTTDPGSPTSNIALNFFSFPTPGGVSPPFAAGDGFLLSMEYLGTPANLSSSTTGFLGQTTASGGFYTFAPSLTLLPNTQYFFYENVVIAGLAGGNNYAGGVVYFANTSSSNFFALAVSHNFQVTGTPVAAGVPDNGSTVMLLGIGVVAIAFARRCLSTLGWA